MADLARLIIEADSSQVKESNTELKTLINTSTGVDRALNKMSSELKRASESADVFSIAFREGERITKALMTPSEKYKESVEELNRLLSIGAFNQETYSRAMKNASDEFSLLSGETDKLRKEQDVLNKKLEEGRRITEGVRTPLEKYNDDVSKLDDMLRSGTISQETYNRSLQVSKQEYSLLSGEVEQLRKEQDLLNKKFDEGKRITDSLRTPSEKYKDHVSKLKDLLKSGAISQDTFNRSLKQATNEYKSADGMLSKLSGSFFSLRTAIAGTIVMFSVGVAKNFYDVNNKFDTMNSKMNASISTYGNASKELAYTSEEADRLGLKLVDVTKGYSDFAAASLRSDISLKDTRKIFDDIMTAAVSMRTPNEKIDLITSALTQMASKGRISSEELRQQLGDHLPAAMKIAEKSMGMTTDQFNKALEKGEILSKNFLPNFGAQVRKELGGSFEQSSKSIQSNVNRIDNNVTVLKGKIAGLFVDNANSGLSTINDSLTSLNDSFASIRFTVELLLVPVSLVWNALQSLATIIDGFLMIVYNGDKMILLPFIKTFQLLNDEIMIAGKAVDALSRRDFKALKEIGGEALDDVKKRSGELTSAMSQSWEDIKLTVMAVGGDINKQSEDVATQIAKLIMSYEDLDNTGKKVSSSIEDRKKKDKKPNPLDLVSVKDLERQIELMQEGINVTKSMLNPLESLYVEEAKLKELFRAKAIDQTTYNRALSKTRDEYYNNLQAEIDSLTSGLLTQEEQIKQSYERRHDAIILSTILTETEKNQYLDKLEKQYHQQLNDNYYDGLLTQEEQLNQSYQRRSEIILANTEMSELQKKDILDRINKEHEQQLYDHRNQVYDSFYNGLLTEEEQINLSYQRRAEAILKSTELTEMQVNDLMFRLGKERNTQISALESSRLQMTATTLMNMADMNKNFAKHQTGLYKALFATSKAFSIADAAVQIKDAIAKALNLPFPANIPAMITVGGLGAGIMADLAAIKMNFAGAFDGGGNIPYGKWGIAGERGPEVVKGPATVISRKDTAKLLENSNQGRELNATFIFQDSSGTETERVRAKIRSREYDSVVDDFMTRAQQKGYKVLT